MKKLIFCAFFVLYTIILSAQSFHKGALVVDGKAAIEIYNTKFYQKYNPTGKDTLVEDRAGNRSLSIGVEYGIIDRLGAGIRYTNSKYFADPDDSTKMQPNIQSHNIMAIINCHLVNKKILGLHTGINVGYSSFTAISNNINKDVIYGKGFYFDWHLTPSVWIGPFGFHWDISVPFVNYGKVTTNNPDFNKDYTNKLKFLGYGIGTGIQYRFLSKKKTDEGEKSIE